MSTPPRLALSRFLAGLAGVALVATGCGGGGGGSTADPTTRVPVATTAPPPGLQQLQSIVVQASDLPAGWTAKPASPPSDRVAAAAALATCMGSPDTTGDEVATAYSPNFVSGTTVISSVATSYNSRADVPTDSFALTSPKASACFLQVGKTRLAAALPKGSVVKSNTYKVTPGTGGGPVNVVATAMSAVTYTSAGHQVTLNDQTVYFAAPRIEAHIDFYDVGKPIDAKVKAALLNKFSQRVIFGS